jgi:hypothetical protein
VDRKSKRRWLLLVFSLVILATLAPATYWTVFIPERLKSDIRGYDGDGTAQFLGGNIVSYRCAISFDWFDLSKDFDAQYKITHLPRTGKEYSILLETPGSKDQIDLLAAGTLGLNISRTNGTSVVDFNAPIERWDKGNGGHDVFEAPMGVLFRFDPKTPAENTDFIDDQRVDNENLIVSVSYRAGPNLPKNFKGRVCVESGGFW